MTYPSKILLFGEHTVLYNSQALSIPFDTFFGDWEFRNEQDIRLIGLVDKLDGNLIKTAAFKMDCEKGLYFNSSIPLQSGLGSSGALTAAIYKTYANHIHTDIKLVQKDLATIESIFHGQSSGTDALVSFLNETIHSKENQSIVLKKNPLQSMPFYVYLYDSAVKRSAKTYINQFIELAESEVFNVKSNSTLVNDIVDHILSESFFGLSNQLALLSEFQFRHLTSFIPTDLKQIWEQGLKNKSYYFKLCGAGGGGFFLVFSKDDIMDLFPDKLIYLNKRQ